MYYCALCNFAVNFHKSTLPHHIVPYWDREEQLEKQEKTEKCVYRWRDWGNVEWQARRTWGVCTRELVSMRLLCGQVVCVFSFISKECNQWRNCKSSIIVQCFIHIKLPIPRYRYLPPDNTHMDVPFQNESTVHSITGHLR